MTRQEFLTELRATSPWRTPDEAAAYVGMTPRGLEDLRYRRVGPTFSRLGRRVVRYHLDDLDAWLKGGRQ